MTSIELREALRQMLAVLEEERQALAGLDLDAIVGAANDKNRLCGTLDAGVDGEIDEECRGMLDAAKRLNEVNRQVRNLIAANVSARLNALTGSPQLYRAGPRYGYAGGRA
ncbi:flagellar protein FlgN [Novosphingobium album (ex Liu et al. 2023)]|uniref:Flagellar protein FlgN n=1 Tax=Novosphingobium album (ex Liu et al. 2023) TaxID=3031130 RepID=A0ABT5WM87_9SPHN|nr:flagellar protein FlgN [Novosphingobium album (ex Liu et al. 2023)]MDE8651158.1 flagellar protein FlgN [Novosphingobium album (ex Liu et al. 2023)]